MAYCVKLIWNTSNFISSQICKQGGLFVVVFAHVYPCCVTLCLLSLILCVNVTKIETFSVSVKFHFKIIVV